jgi:hypothetical protein
VEADTAPSTVLDIGTIDVRIHESGISALRGGGVLGRMAGASSIVFQPLREEACWVLEGEQRQPNG